MSTQTKLAVIVTCLIATLGCRPSGSVSPAPSTPRVELLQLAGSDAILAQGRLRPAGGVIPVAAMAGDRIAEIMVAEGDHVQAGQVVVRLASEKLRELERIVAKTQLEEAKAQLAAEEHTGQTQLELAKLGVAKNNRLLSNARQALQRATAAGGELDLLQSKVGLNEDELARLRQASIVGPDGRRLVNDTQLRQQELVVQAARAELNSARRDAESAVEVAEMLVDASEQEILTAEAKAAAARSSVFLESMALKIELLDEQIEAARLTSPINGTVLSIDASTGQPTTGMAILRIADISTMRCVAEVAIEDIGKVKIGSTAKINQGGLGQEHVGGRVTSISRIVGSPSVPSLNPMDPVDYRTIEVTITINPEDTDRAANLIHSQVEVAIIKEP